MSIFRLLSDHEYGKQKQKQLSYLLADEPRLLLCKSCSVRRKCDSLKVDCIDTSSYRGNRAAVHYIYRKEDSLKWDTRFVQKAAECRHLDDPSLDIYVGTVHEQSIQCRTRTIEIHTNRSSYDSGVLAINQGNQQIG